MTLQYGARIRTATRPKTRVARGIQFLDDTLPNWRELIDVVEFDIESPGACILGQAFAGKRAIEYESGWATGTLRLMKWMESHRMTLQNPDGSEVIQFGFEREPWGDYDDLEREWRKHLVGGLAVYGRGKS